MGGIKIIFPDIAIEPRFALDTNGYYGSNTTYFIPLNDLHLLGLLNSKLAGFYFRQVCAGLESKNDTYLRFFGQYLEGFPVRAEKKAKGKIADLVKEIMDFARQVANAKPPHEKTALGRQFEATDKQIDKLVYDLYGLTDEEIKVIETVGAS